MTQLAEDVARWLAQARNGSRDALGQMLEAYRTYLLLIANRQLAPDLQAKGGASDVVQETFLEAQRDFAAFQGESADELQAWLRQLLLHNVANLGRHYRQTAKRELGREVRLEPPTPSGGAGTPVAADTPSPSGRAMAQEEAARVQALIQRLPDDYRQVIVWRYQDGRSFAEIAEQLGRSENAVRKLWFRAVERLEQELGKQP